MLTGCNNLLPAPAASFPSILPWSHSSKAFHKGDTCPWAMTPLDCQERARQHLYFPKGRCSLLGLLTAVRDAQGIRSPRTVVF